MSDLRPHYGKLTSLKAGRRFAGYTPFTVADYVAFHRRSFPRPMRFASKRRFDMRDAPMHAEGWVRWPLRGVLGIRTRIKHQIWLRNYHAWNRGEWPVEIKSLGELEVNPWRGPCRGFSKAKMG